VKTLLTLFLVILFPVMAAATSGNLTQRDWVRNLTTGMGWDFGLPDEPDDADYLRILSGERQFFFEAENHIQPTDMVARKYLRNYGPFSGKEWVSGVARTSYAHLKCLIPVSGDYLLSTRLLGADFKFTIGNQTIEVKGEDRVFKDVEVGRFQFLAGEQEITVAIPPGGGIDSLTFYAPNLTPIAPAEGWRLDDPLEWEDLAVNTLQFLDLLEWLPRNTEAVTIEAETADLPDHAEISSANHLGHPSGGSWVRASSELTRVSISFQPPRSGVYLLSARALGNDAISLQLDESLDFSRKFGPSFTTLELGTVTLSDEEHTLVVDLPRRAGIDSLQLTPLDISQETSLALTGLDMRSGRPGGIEVDRLINLLRILAPER